MDDRLWFTDDDDANALLVSDPMALLVGFVLDQQVTVQKAFSGPAVVLERLGTLDAAGLAEADLEPLFRERPAVHRFPKAMAERVQALGALVRDRYDGDAARVWTDAADADELRANLMELPGFGTMKVGQVAAVLHRRLGVAVAAGIDAPEPTLGDVDSTEALHASQAQKRDMKARARAEREGSG